MQNKKKRSVIVKVGNTQFVKYEYVNNLPRFALFLNAKFPGWRYANVFDRETGKQISSFTKNKLPTTHL